MGLRSTRRWSQRRTSGPGTPVEVPHPQCHSTRTDVELRLVKDLESIETYLTCTLEGPSQGFETHTTQGIRMMLGHSLPDTLGSTFRLVTPCPLTSGAGLLLLLLVPTLVWTTPDHANRCSVRPFREPDLLAYTRRASPSHGCPDPGGPLLR